MAHSLELLAEKYSQVIENLNGEAVKKTVKMSYGDFLAKYKKSIAKHTADFIDDDPENEDEAEQMAVDAVVDDLEHQGIHVELTNEGHDETDMSNPEERTEVHIAKEILKATDMNEVKRLARELLNMHGQNLKMPRLNLKPPSQNLPSIYNRKFTNPVHGPEHTRVYKKYHSNEWHG